MFNFNKRLLLSLTGIIIVVLSYTIWIIIPFSPKPISGQFLLFNEKPVRGTTYTDELKNYVVIENWSYKIPKKLIVNNTTEATIQLVLKKYTIDEANALKLFEDYSEHEMYKNYIDDLDAGSIIGYELLSTNDKQGFLEKYEIAESDYELEYPTIYPYQITANGPFDFHSSTTQEPIYDMNTYNWKWYLTPTTVGNQGFIFNISKNEIPDDVYYKYEAWDSSSHNIFRSNYKDYVTAEVVGSLGVSERVEVITKLFGWIIVLIFSSPLLNMILKVIKPKLNTEGKQKE